MRRGDGGLLLSSRPSPIAIVRFALSFSTERSARRPRARLEYFCWRFFFPSPRDLPERTAEICARCGPARRVAPPDANPATRRRPDVTSNPPAKPYPFVFGSAYVLSSAELSPYQNPWQPPPRRKKRGCSDAAFLGWEVGRENGGEKKKNAAAGRPYDVRSSHEGKKTPFFFGRVETSKMMAYGAGGCAAAPDVP